MKAMLIFLLHSDHTDRLKTSSFYIIELCIPRIIIPNYRFTYNIKENNIYCNIKYDTINIIRQFLQTVNQCKWIIIILKSS